VDDLPDLDQLRSLLTVAQFGSISAAAPTLLRTQSAVSVQVSQLEKILGHQLFDRHPRGVTLTRHGEIAVEYGHQILELVHRLRDSLAETTLSGTIRMGLAEDYAIGRLPRLLREFAQMRETLELQLVVSQSMGLDRYIREGLVDLALAVPEVMSTEPFARWSTPLLWVASRDFVVDLEKPIPFVTIGEVESPWRKGPHPWDHRIFSRLEEAGLRWRIACSTSTVMSMLSAVEAGIGISYFTRESLRRSVRILSELDGFPPPVVVEFGLFAPTTQKKMLSPLIEVLSRTVLEDVAFR
jgi:DNA-binding transcriptional LysR family regulator